MAKTTEPLGTIVQQKDRMLTVNKDAQLKAFTGRLASLSAAKSATIKKE